MIKPHIDTLPNKLRVLTLPMDTPSVTVLVLFGAGSRYETREEAGISHFLEHMMFKGTKKRPTAIDIAREIDGIGGEFNAYTSKDYTGYYIKAANTHLPFMIDILSDMTLNSKLEQEEIDREKGVIVEEMNMYEDTPMRKVGEVFENLLYGDTALGRDIIGNKHSVTSFASQNFRDYMKKLYRPQNALIIVSGGVKNKKEVTKLIQNSFGAWKNKPTAGFDQAQIHDKKVHIISKKTEQTHVCVGTQTFGSDDPRRFVLGVLSTVLGGGMSSRLFHEVRERRGLAYYVRSGVERYSDTGNFVTQAGVDIKRSADAVSIILKEYDKITRKKGAVTQGELKRAKEFLKGHLILAMEDSKSVAQIHGNQLLLEGKVRILEEAIKGIESVSSNDISSLAKELFEPKNLRIAAIGPFSSSITSKIDAMFA